MDGRPTLRHPVEKAVDHLSRAFPLKTPEWSAWSATMRPARLEGTLGDQRHGNREGTGVWSRRAQGRNHAGRVHAPRPPCSMRAQASGCRARAKPSSTPAFNGAAVRSVGRRRTSRDLREVMFVDRDWRTIEGRWFTGGYDEIGLDVQARSHWQRTARARHRTHRAPGRQHRSVVPHLRSQPSVHAASRRHRSWYRVLP